MSDRIEGHTQRIGFLLVTGFALMSFASAAEPLRAANILAGRALYDVRVFAEVEGPVASSSPFARVEAQGLPESAEGLSTLFVCAGGSPADWHRPALHAALRRYAGQGLRLGGISGGPYLLAAAGLLTARRFTIHWEHAPALVEAFPHLVPEPARFVIDRNRLTCGGGIAPLDMMHALITERLGADFARRVSDWYLHAKVAEPTGPQRASLPERYGMHHPALVAVLEKMETSLEAPLPRAAMARLAGVSPRHLDRLFAEKLGSSFAHEYRRLRLEHARRLLKESPLSIAEIAFATGFSSASHFSRRFSERFETSPAAYRRALDARRGPAAPERF